jgi:hypothetical protein
MGLKAMQSLSVGYKVFEIGLKVSPFRLKIDEISGKFDEVFHKGLFAKPTKYKA